MRALAIAWKDFRHTYRNIAALAMMIAAPLVLSTALGAAFGGASNFSIQQVKTVLVNQDTVPSSSGENVGAIIQSTLASPSLKNLINLQSGASPDAARKDVDQAKAGVAVLVPAGLTQALFAAPGTGASGAGTPGASLSGAGGAGPGPALTVYQDPSLSVGPGIVADVVRSVVQDLNGARAAATTAVQLAAAAGIADPTVLTAVAAKAAQAYTDSAQSARPVTVADRAPSAAAGPAAKEPNVASQVLIGMMIFFMFFGAAQPARSILDEHRRGTLPRLFTTPTSRSAILGGKYISVFMVVLVQSVVLLLAGKFFFGADWGAMGPVVALTISGALVAASLALLMISFARTAGQAGAFSSAIFVFLGLLGGNFVGTTNIGGAFATARRITPNGWLLEGWNNVLYGGSWHGVLLPVGAVLAFTLVFFAVATFFFRRRYA